MNASYEWLRSLVPVTLAPREISELLTARCAQVEETVALRADLATIVVARVVEAGRHPDSDHLWLTKVDAGGEALLDVVCGAPNVRAGALYPFAAVGTVLPDGLKLEKRKIRGVVSNGMLCSARELKLSEDHEGILEITGDVAPGTPFLRAMPVGDTRFVIDVLPNRPDLLSHVGLAREIAAATGVSLAFPPREREAELRWVVDPKEARAGAVTVRIEDADGVHRLTGVVLRGITVGPSPAWLAARLVAVGARPINNVVDVTNYLLHELGQPMHAFDLDRLAGGTVVARRARSGEKITTLDSVERALTTEMTVIADGERAHAVAGVMGGGDAEVRPETRNIFLEVARFDPRRIRATRGRLGMSTDASYRFERGIDPALQPVALSRAVALIREVAGGAVDGAAVDLGPETAPAASLTLRLSRVSRVLGVSIPPEDVARLLESVGYGVTLLPPGHGQGRASGGATELAVFQVNVPSWRGDVTREVDLIEDIARLRGYDTFPSALRPYRLGVVPDSSHLAPAARVADALIASGLCETRPMPFVRGDPARHVRVANPLSEDEAYLRRGVLESLARRAEHNLAHMQGTVRLFEIGAVFAPSGAALPHEAIHVGVLIMGDRRPVHFTEPKPPEFDAWDAKGVAERALEAAFPGEESSLVAGEGSILWTIRVGGREVGAVSRVALDAPVWARPAYGIEFLLAKVESDPIAPPGASAWRAPAESGGAAANVERRYRPIPVTPAVELDLALITPDSVSAEAVEHVIRRSAGELLERLMVFDEFRGEGVPAGTRSVAWRLTFRHPSRTLREKEIEGRRTTLLRTLEDELGVRQRTN